MKQLNCDLTFQEIWFGFDEKLYRSVDVVRGDIKAGIINFLWTQTYQEELRGE